MYKISFSRINDLFGAINFIMKLYLPAENDGEASFQPYSDGVKPNLDSVNTVRSAKDFFFPQTENIAEFKLSGKNIEIREFPKDGEPFAVFGVRACDVKSFEILDRVFLSEPCDPYYNKKRDNAVIIALSCNRPDEACFCTAFDINPAKPGGDVSVWHDSDSLFWKSNTEKGDALTKKISAVMTECGENEADAIIRDIASAAEKQVFGNLNLDYWKNTDEKTIFESDKWDSVYKGCLGCGVCTFVCPTCQCYDVKEFDAGQKINKFRCWDSCMYSDFTKMAHGNPRKTQKERFRQRFMHKLKYFPDNNDGIFSCVGCGRCLRSCPQKLNIVKIAKEFLPDD